MGHGATILAVGSAIIALRLAVPARTALGLEFLVGLVLIALGILNLRAPGTGDAPHRESAGLGTPLRRSFCVGLVHGLAGSAAVALPLAAMPTIPAALAYLAVFCVGTIGVRSRWVSACRSASRVASRGAALIVAGSGTPRRLRRLARLRHRLRRDCPETSRRRP
jgi:hypothetical protein